MLQAREGFPTQGAPLLEGEGLVQVLFWNPPPQVVLQPPKALHPPSTALELHTSSPLRTTDVNFGGLPPSKDDQDIWKENLSELPDFLPGNHGRGVIVKLWPEDGVIFAPQS